MGVVAINTILDIEGLTKDYTDRTGHMVHLLEDINLKINDEEFTAILAPTGAGKSSLLKIIADLEPLSSGKITDNSKKKIFIPSEPSSFPWLNVKENILFNIKDNDQDKLQNIINLVVLKAIKIIIRIIRVMVFDSELQLHVLL